MRQRLLLLLLAGIWLCAPAQHIARYEYWTDGDTDSRQQATATGGDISFLADASHLAEGMHALHFRAQDSEGRWSAPQTGYFMRQPARQDPAAVLHYEYWTDDDTANRISGTTTGDVVSFSLDANALRRGMHTLHYRVSDASGRWSAPQTAYFMRVSASADASATVDYEYWIDSDVAHRTRGTATGGVVNLSINTAGIAQGLHAFHFRAKDADGRWSTPQTCNFMRIATTEDKAEPMTYEYWIDQDETHKTTGITDNGMVVIRPDVNSLTEGKHYFIFRIREGNGNWSAPYVHEFTKVEPLPDHTPPSLMAMTPEAGAEDVMATGQVVLKFSEPIDVELDVQATLNGMVLKPVVADSLLVFNYQELSYHTQYTFVLPANSLTDLAGNAFSEDITLTFTTMDSPIHAIASTDKQLYLPGETVLIQGTTEGTLKNKRVEICVEGAGLKLLIPTTTDDQGTFKAEWTPYSEQTGRLSVGVLYDDEPIAEQTVQVDIVGLKQSHQGYITCQPTVDEPFEGTIELQNLCSFSQLLNEVQVLAKPEDCEIAIDQPASIAAGGRAAIKYTLTGSQPTEGSDWELVQLRISTMEGATLDMTLYYYCRTQQASLIASESHINTTMTKGGQRDYALTIANQGMGETGRIWLSLPDVPWMKLVTPAELSSLTYGEEATVVLRLSPGDDLPLNVPQTGTIGINCANGAGLAIAYSIEAVSDATGTLVVDVLDEFSGDDALGPHVANATVTVTHPTTGAVIAQGTTTADGTFTTTLPEGYYALKVQAEKHEEYSATVLVDPGREQRHEAFISYEAITYSWTMEETEINDEYEVTTTATFETNVPKPVLVITLPARKPKPGEVFPVTVTNHGLINTEHVSLTAVITSPFVVEMLNSGALDVLGPGQSHTFYCVVNDEAQLWESSCVTAYFLADGYYQCRGTHHVQARADLYSCQRSADDTVTTGGSWPGAGPGGPALGGGAVTGGATGGTTPWISWPCETCPARVKLQIVQTVSMLRPAYRGTLMLYNGHDSEPIRNVRLHLTITGEDGEEAARNAFAIEVESLKAFGGELALPGGWTLPEGQTGEANVLFVPTQQAAPDGPRKYTFNGTLTCTDPFTGQELTLPLGANTFTVQPLPNLELTYLMQRDVYGDDPLTTGVKEPSVPAEFALIINNKGNGDAKSVRIVTEQPKVVENGRGLPINFAITRSQVNGDSAHLVLSPVIANSFGTIPAHSQAYAQWWLESSLLGHFVGYETEATHLSKYGDADLSLVDTVSIHEMIHGFTDTTGTRRGYLVNDLADNGDLPDRVYFTDATQEDVHAGQGFISPEGDGFVLRMMPAQAGWNYGAVDDPTEGTLAVAELRRLSDGAIIPTDNVWQTSYTLRDSRDWLYEHRLHFVACLPDGGDEYRLTFRTHEEVGIGNVIARGSGQALRLRFVAHGDWLTISGLETTVGMQRVEFFDLRGMKQLDVQHVRVGDAIYCGHLPTGVYQVVVTTTDDATWRGKVVKR